MSRVVVIEDQTVLLLSLKRGLEEEGFQVFTAATGGEGYRLIQREPCDIVLLDLMLPEGDGISLLKRLREEGFEKPVMIMTAKDRVEDRVSGLDCGADDYLVKPFDFSEMLARLRALLRRCGSIDQTSMLRCGDLILDRLQRKAMRAGHQLRLTQRQFELLEYLMKHKNEVVSRETLARDVWQTATATWTNVIEVQINQLRKKLATPNSEPVLFTVRGEGYVLGDER